MSFEFVAIAAAGLAGIIFGFLLAVSIRPGAASRRPRFSATAYGIKPDQLTQSIADLETTHLDSPDGQRAQQIRWNRAITQVQRFVKAFPDMPTCRALEDVSARIARNEAVGERESFDALLAVVVTISALNYIGQRVFGEA